MMVTMGDAILLEWAEPSNSAHSNTEYATNIERRAKWRRLHTERTT
jgi:hypothetical protein